MEREILRKPDGALQTPISEPLQPVGISLILVLEEAVQFSIKYQSKGMFLRTNGPFDGEIMCHY